jgi:hypothetical protein
VRKATTEISSGMPDPNKAYIINIRFPRDSREYSAGRETIRNMLQDSTMFQKIEPRPKTEPSHELNKQAGEPTVNELFAFPERVNAEANINFTASMKSFTAKHTIGFR